jgi:hypothetical protein
MERLWRSDSVCSFQHRNARDTTGGAFNNEMACTMLLWSRGLVII